MSAPLIVFPKSFPRPDAVRALIEFGMAHAPDGTEVHVKSRALRKTWHVDGFGVGFSTRAGAARAFPDREPYPRTDWGTYLCSARAYRDAGADEMCKLAPGSRWLVTMTIPTPEAYSSMSFPLEHVYPGKRDSSAPWPRIGFLSWEDDVVHTAAHEAQHLVQFVNGSSCSEIEAEEVACRRLREWRDLGAVDDGPPATLHCYAVTP